MTITEPMTLATDYLLAVFTASLAWRLRRAAQMAAAAHQAAVARLRRWWAVAFLATAIAGVSGGTVHGFQQVLPGAVLSVLWLVTLETLVAAAFAVTAVAVTIAGSGPVRERRWLLASAAAFALYGALVVARTPVYLTAIVAYGVAFAVLLAVRLSMRPWDAGARLLIAGVVVSAVAAAIQQSGWSLHRHFNHNDLYHVVQALGVWLLFRSATAATVATPK
jgi:hypothetical protein